MSALKSSENIPSIEGLQEIRTKLSSYLVRAKKALLGDPEGTEKAINEAIESEKVYTNLPTFSYIMKLCEYTMKCVHISEGLLDIAKRNHSSAGGIKPEFLPEVNAYIQSHGRVVADAPFAVYTFKLSHHDVSPMVSLVKQLSPGGSHGTAAQLGWNQSTHKQIDGIIAKLLSRCDAITEKTEEIYMHEDDRSHADIIREAARGRTLLKIPKGFISLVEDISYNALTELTHTTKSAYRTLAGK